VGDSPNRCYGATAKHWDEKMSVYKTKTAENEGVLERMACPQCGQADQFTFVGMFNE